MKAALFIAVLFAGFAPLSAYARPVDDLEPIVREMQIAEDVFRSSLRNSVPTDIRISKIEVQYLARQGVLVSVDMLRPWLRFNKRGQTGVTIDADFEHFSEIPEMVQDILTRLEISIPSSYGPEELDDLRELRVEQRELRKEQRELQAELRVKRRELVRTDDDDEQDRINDEIAELERELKAVDAQNDALNEDLDARYERLSEARTSRREPNSPLDVDAAVAETACNYGGTFKSLGSQQYLTVAVNQHNLKRYFVFKMEHIGACRRGDIDPGELLDRSYVYET